MGCGSSVDLATAPLGASLPSTRATTASLGSGHALLLQGETTHGRTSSLGASGVGVGTPRGRTPSTIAQYVNGRKRTLLEPLEDEPVHHNQTLLHQQQQQQIPAQNGPGSHRLHQSHSFKLPPISGTVTGTAGANIKIRDSSFSSNNGPTHVISGTATTATASTSPQMEPIAHRENTTTHTIYQQDHSQQFDHSVGPQYGDHLYVAEKYQINQPSAPPSVSNKGSNTLQQPTRFVFPRISTVATPSTPNMNPTTTANPSPPKDDEPPPTFIRHNSLSPSATSRAMSDEVTNANSNTDLPRPKAVKPGVRLPAVEGQVKRPHHIVDQSAATPRLNNIDQHPQQPQQHLLPKSHTSPIFAANSFAPPSIITTGTHTITSTGEIVGISMAMGGSRVVSPTSSIPHSPHQPSTGPPPNAIAMSTALVYTESNPEYLDYKKLWSEENHKEILRRKEQKNNPHFSRSLLTTPDRSACTSPYLNGVHGSPVKLAGLPIFPSPGVVISPLMSSASSPQFGGTMTPEEPLSPFDVADDDGCTIGSGYLVGERTALALLVEDKQPSGVVSPVPGFRVMSLSPVPFDLQQGSPTVIPPPPSRSRLKVSSGALSPVGGTPAVMSPRRNSFSISQFSAGASPSPGSPLMAIHGSRSPPPIGQSVGFGSGTLGPDENGSPLSPQQQAALQVQTAMVLSHHLRQSQQTLQPTNSTSHLHPSSRSPHHGHVHGGGHQRSRSHLGYSSPHSVPSAANATAEAQLLLQQHIMIQHQQQQLLLQQQQLQQQQLLQLQQQQYFPPPVATAVPQSSAGTQQQHPPSGLLPMLPLPVTTVAY